jgi:hypothetical protein
MDDESGLHPLFQPGLPDDFRTNTTLLAIANVEVAAEGIDDVKDDDARLQKDFRRKRRISNFAVEQEQKTGASSTSSSGAPVPPAAPAPSFSSSSSSSSSSSAGPLRASAHAKRGDRGATSLISFTSSNPFRKHMPRAGRLELASANLKPIPPRLHLQQNGDGVSNVANSSSSNLKGLLSHSSPLISAKPKLFVDADTGVLIPAPPLLDLRATGPTAAPPTPPSSRGVSNGGQPPAAEPAGLSSAPGRLSRNPLSSSSSAAGAGGAAALYAKSPGAGSASGSGATAADPYGPLAGPDPEIASLTLFMKVWRPDSARGEESPAPAVRIR